MALTLTNIPVIMDSKGWNNGAKLMRTWFSRPATSYPSYGPPETSTIRMDAWVLKFPKAKLVYDRLVREKIWANPAAQAQLESVLQRKGFFDKPSNMSRSNRVGDLGLPVEIQDADHINFRSVTFDILGDPLDDMFAALANFNLRVVVSASVEPLDNTRSIFDEYRVTIDEVGVYVADSYDFVGPQELGFWDDSDNSAGKSPLSGTRVTNADFRAWRTANGKGGDFLVFSDGKRIRLAPPEIFIIHHLPVEFLTPPPSMSRVAPRSAPPPALFEVLPPAPVDAVDKVDVHPGDTLSGLAKVAYGSYDLWPLLWDANRAVIGSNPNLLKPGTKLRVPPRSSFSGPQIANARRRAPSWKTF
jgi:hypothetical protein